MSTAPSMKATRIGRRRSSHASGSAATHPREFHDDHLEGRRAHLQRRSSRTGLHGVQAPPEAGRSNWAEIRAIRAGRPRGRGGCGGNPIYIRSPEAVETGRPGIHPATPEARRIFDGTANGVAPSRHGSRIGGRGPRRRPPALNGAELRWLRYGLAGGRIGGAGGRPGVRTRRQASPDYDRRLSFSIRSRAPPCGSSVQLRRGRRSRTGVPATRWETDGLRPTPQRRIAPSSSRILMAGGGRHTTAKPIGRPAFRTILFVIDATNTKLGRLGPDSGSERACARALISGSHGEQAGYAAAAPNRNIRRPMRRSHGEEPRPPAPIPLRKSLSIVQYTNRQDDC